MATHLLRSDDWKALAPAQRVEQLLGMSLDDCYELLQWPLVEAARNPSVMSAKIQVIRAILNATVKMGLADKRLEVEREKILADLSKREFGEEKS